MCGIAGFWQTGSSSDTGELARVVGSMAATLLHRGPDDGDFWCDAAAGVGLAHRRLAVVDLSAAGHQPMLSHDGRFVIVYNGELYNTAEVRADVEACAGAIGWRGHSDTEVLLEAISVWGVRAALRRVVGMFAFALWDRRERLLTLARDRIGEKPLYFGTAGGTLLFASELKAMRAHPSWRGEIDRDALALYVRYGCVPAPHSIYRGMHKLLPGCVAEFSSAAQSPHIEPYWSALEVARAGLAAPRREGEAELADELDRLLRRAVKGQMAADVPLGAFLSGGIDSSTVVALMQAQSERRIKTFTIGFAEAEYNEADHARAVAAHLGTEHTELIVTPEQARAAIPRLPDIYCEPFADSSQIPTFLVAELARSKVTVALSGDAGDELFGGYNRYQLAPRLWRQLLRVPRPVRTGAARIARGLSPGSWDRLFVPARTVLPRQLRVRTPGDKLHKAAGLLPLHNLDAVYLRLLSNWDDPAALVPGSKEPETMHSNPALLLDIQQPLARMMLLDLVGYLPDDILVKTDRAAMAVSLETRVPLLDHRVVEFAWQVPLEHKVRDGRGKHLLRTVLERYVPRSLFERPKMGFGVPIGHWLRGPLRDWAEHLLDPSVLGAQGYFEVGCIRRAWRDHLSGSASNQYPLWVILMFQAWLERHHDG